MIAKYPIDICRIYKGVDEAMAKEMQKSGCKTYFNVQPKEMSSILRKCLGITSTLWFDADITIQCPQDYSIQELYGIGLQNVHLEKKSQVSFSLRKIDD